MYDPNYWMRYETYNQSEEIVDLFLKLARHREETKPELVEYAEINSRHLTSGNIISRLFETMPGRDCLVVGAGPSAYQNIEAIERASRSGCLIISCDRIHSDLKKAGITPDFTVSVDPSKAVGDFLKLVDDKDSLVMNITQNPHVIDGVLSRTDSVYFHAVVNPYSVVSRKFMEKYPVELTCLKGGGVVGFSAADLAYWLTRPRGRVVLIGMDCGWRKREDVDIVLQKGWLSSEEVKAIDESDLLFENFSAMSSAVFGTVTSDGREFFTIRNFIMAAAAFDSLKILYGDAEFMDASDGIIQNMTKANINEIFKEVGNEQCAASMG